MSPTVGTHAATQVGIRPDKMRRVARPPMIKRTYYVPETLYDAALEKAEEDGLALSDIIRAALERYVREPDARD